MKLTTLVLGFLVFSIVASMFFAAAFDILRWEIPENEASDFNALSGDYHGVSDDFSDSDSTARQMQEQMDTGVAGSLESDVVAYKGAFSSIKLSLNFIGNFENIVHNATGDVNYGGESYIDSRITNGIITILVIIFVFIIIHFIRGFKTET